ncbi:MAG TPA: DUF3106 domain-containing protein [Opitutaceae bacterium]|jgi:hypothetical protein|nr:DUF3106 domain-containing protein [Opitutaceae bacterium]HRE08226.1 DUF3106 domain-containing protein [Opitutaceae bacterium]
MKTLVCLGFTLVLVVGTVAGQTPPARAAQAPAPGELAALEQFLNRSDAELAQMEAVIARIRAMTPEQRSALRREIASYRQLPEPQRQELRLGWGGVSADLQTGWREMMQSSTPERRAEIQAMLQSLGPSEKTRYRQELVEAYLKARAEKK